MDAEKTKVVLIIVAIGLLIFEVNLIDYSRFWAWRNFSNLLTPLFLIVLVVIIVRQLDSKRKDKSQ